MHWTTPHQKNFLKAAGFTIAEKCHIDGIGYLEFSHKSFDALAILEKRAKSHGFTFFRYMRNGKPHVNMY